MSSMTGGIGSSVGLQGAGSGSMMAQPQRYSDGDNYAVASVTNDATVAEAKEIIQKVLQTDVVPFLWGPPGIGKSSIIKQICEESDLEMIDFRLSTVNPVDLMGVPSIDQKEQVARWFRPDFLPKEDTKTKGILFLDELNLAPLSVQAAAYQLILDKRVGAYRFPKSWKIVAAGNRETDRANVYKISAPLANRFMHISVRPDLDAWIMWAKGKIDDSVLAFLMVRAPLLFRMPTDSQKAFPSPRSWQYVSDFVKAFNYSPGTRPSIPFQMAVVGAVGQGVGEEFLKYISDYDMMEIGNLVNRFIETGEIKLPSGSKASQLSTRFAITTAITSAYKHSKIERSRFEDFLSKLEAEERAAVRKQLAEADKIVSENETYTFLEADLDPQSTSMLVNDTTVFKSPTGMAELVSPNNKEHETVKYSVKGSKGISIERGTDNTTAKRFLAGSYVKPI